MPSAAGRRAARYRCSCSCQFSWPHCLGSAASMRATTSEACDRSVSSSSGIASRRIQGSSRSRSSKNSCTSARDSIVTNAPRWAMVSTSPSALNRRSASRTGMRLTPSSSANSSWRSGSPGGMSPTGCGPAIRRPPVPSWSCARCAEGWRRTGRMSAHCDSLCCKGRASMPWPGDFEPQAACGGPRRHPRVAARPNADTRGTPQRQERADPAS